MSCSRIASKHPLSELHWARRRPFHLGLLSSSSSSLKPTRGDGWRRGWQGAEGTALHEGGGGSETNDDMAARSGRPFRTLAASGTWFKGGEPTFARDLPIPDQLNPAGDTITAELLLSPSYFVACSADVSAPSVPLCRAARNGWRLLSHKK